MNASEIKRNFKYRLIGNNFMKKMVIETLLIMPEKIAEYISEHCWFISSFEDGWAFVLRGKEVKRNEYVVFLSDELLKEGVGQIRSTIAHEIAHVIIGHRNSIGKVQTKREIRNQEKEAHEFVKKYLQE